MFHEYARPCRHIEDRSEVIGHRQGLPRVSNLGEPKHRPSSRTLGGPEINCRLRDRLQLRWLGAVRGEKRRGHHLDPTQCAEGCNDR